MQYNSEMLYSVVKLIFPYILAFSLGLLAEHYRMKKSNIREKAKEIDKEELVFLKNSIATIKEIFDEKNYVTYDSKKFNLRVDENLFINNINFSSIFKIENDEIVLSYKMDKILNKHMPLILQCLNEYQKKASHLRKNLNYLVLLGIPNEFQNSLIELIIDEFGTNKLSTEDRNDEFSLLLYIIALTRSYNSYTSGRIFVKDLIKKRFQDLQKIAIDDPKERSIFNEIKNNIENINSNLIIADREIQALHDDWQNKLMV